MILVNLLRLWRDTENVQGSIIELSRAPSACMTRIAREADWEEAKSGVLMF